MLVHLPIESIVAYDATIYVMYEVYVPITPPPPGGGTSSNAIAARRNVKIVVMYIVAEYPF